jgi:hypothetical protein
VTTFILPAAPWAILLGPIMQDAAPGDVLCCGTREMYDLALEAVREAGREDLVVRLDRKERAA